MFLRTNDVYVLIISNPSCVPAALGEMIVELYSTKRGAVLSAIDHYRGLQSVFPGSPTLEKFEETLSNNLCISAASRRYCIYLRGVGFYGDSEGFQQDKLAYTKMFAGADSGVHLEIDKDQLPSARG